MVKIGKIIHCINCSKEAYSVNIKEVNWNSYVCNKCKSSLLIGRRFGGILIIGLTGRSTPLGLCDCGKEFKVRDVSHLKNGKQTSCGCHIHMNEIRKKQNRSIGHVFSMAKVTAKERGIEWMLSKDEWKVITAKPCHYCGDPHGNISKGRLRADSTRADNFKYNGIDRYNNDLPYTIENSVPCCKVCNRYKGNLTIDQFINHIKRISKWLK